MRRLTLFLLAIVLSACSAPKLPLSKGTAATKATYSGIVFPQVNLTKYGTTTSSLAQSEVKGKVVNLWASWCEPCQREFPLMANSVKSSHIVAINVNDLSVSNSGQDKADQLVALGNSSLSVWIDSNNELKTKLAIIGLPVTVAVNNQGVIVDSQIGELHQDSLSRLLTAVTK